MKEALKFFGKNIIWVGLALAATVGGHEWAANIFKFFAFVMAALGGFVALVALASEVVDDPMDYSVWKDRWPPTWLVVSKDLVVISLAASQGWFFTATALFVDLFTGEYLHGLANREDEGEGELTEDGEDTP